MKTEKSDEGEDIGPKGVALLDFRHRFLRLVEPEIHLHLAVHVDDGGEFGAAMGAGQSEAGSALEAELRMRRIVMLALRALHGRASRLPIR